MPDYDVYDKYGNKVGELRPAYSDAAAAFGILLIIVLLIGFLVIPYWASYAMGRGTWSDRSILTKLIALPVLGLWIVVWAAVPIDVASKHPGSFFLALIASGVALGGLAIAFNIGKAIAQRTA